jgi:hypothetical protein
VLILKVLIRDELPMWRKEKSALVPQLPVAPARPGKNLTLEKQAAPYRTSLTNILSEHIGIALYLNASIRITKLWHETK